MLGFLILAMFLVMSSGLAQVPPAHVCTEDEDAEQRTKILRIYVEAIDDIQWPSELFAQTDAKYAIIGILWYPRSGIVEISRVERLYKPEGPGRSKSLDVAFLRNRYRTEPAFSKKNAKDFLNRGLFKEVVDGETILDIFLIREKSMGQHKSSIVYLKS